MTTNPKPPVTRNLRLLKEERRMTVREIAVAVDVDQRLVQAWLSESETDPSWGNLLRLAELFGVPQEWFYMDSPTVPSAA